MSMFRGLYNRNEMFLQLGLHDRLSDWDYQEIEIYSALRVMISQSQLMEQGYIKKVIHFKLT